MTSTAIEGTYGDFTFSTTPPGGEDFPDGYNAWAQVELGPFANAVATGLPVGEQILIWAEDGSTLHDTVPCTVNLGNGVQGDLKLLNSSIGHNDVTAHVWLAAPLDGTYGDLTFSTTPEPGDTFPDGYYAYATASVPYDGIVTATGLPVGLGVYITYGDGLWETNSIPCEVDVGSVK